MSDEDRFRVDNRQQQMQQGNKPSEGALSKLKNILYFWSYSGFFARKEHKAPLIIFGKEFSHQEGSQEFKRIIWFTYRKNFPGLVKTDCHSDVGWGCMIRVGQMLLAQSLKRHNKLFLQENNLSIISAFIDDDEDKKDCINYSIQKIAVLGQKMFKLSPGQWLSVCNISYIIQQLHNSFPLRGYERLRIKVFDNGAIFFSTMLKTLGYQVCKCENKTTIFCPQKCHSFNSKLSVMIIVMIRLGAGKPVEKHYPMLMDLFRVTSFNGMIGGKPSKALYLVGTENQSLVYLDPHFVQNSTTRKNLHSNISSYFCQSIRTIQYSQIQPSAGISFYIESLESLMEFSQEIVMLKQKYGNDFILYSTDEEERQVQVQPDSDQIVVSQNSAEMIIKEGTPSVQKPCSFDLDN